jgi:ribosomal protein S18 acetylase RimI-like enzyme
VEHSNDSGFASFKLAMSFDEHNARDSSCHVALTAVSSESQKSRYDSSTSASSTLNSKRRCRCFSWNQMTFLASIALLISSFSVCKSFSPKAGTSTSSRAITQSTILQVVETEAPTAPQQTATTFHPFFTTYTESTPVCEQGARVKNKEEAGEENAEPSEPVAESDNHQFTGDEDMQKENRLEKVAKAAAVGSASRVRGGVASMTRFADAVRRSAGSNILNRPAGPNKEGDGDDRSLSSKLTQAAIQSTVNDMIKSSSRTMGILGEESTTTTNLNEIISDPPPGSVLVDCPKNSRWKASNRVSVRVATQSDDLDIANLRLSVFSNFSPSMRQAFCARSCHILAIRRNQGATCIAATVPRYGSILSTRKEIILGTAECSIHEFYGTKLGSRRRKNSILYITEVAVGPTARKKGIGGKIMQSIDELAKVRGVETLYLHVEVSNYKALSLYERAGYQKVPPNNPIYSEFTKSLNLHDGAMQGRNHYLMHKMLLLNEGHWGSRSLLKHILLN